MRVVPVDSPFGIFFKTIKKRILLKIELHGYCTGGAKSWPGLPQLYQHLFSIKGNVIASTFCFHSLQNFKDIRLFLEVRNVTKTCVNNIFNYYFV